MGVEQARDARLERIKFAATRLAASPCKARSRQPNRDRAPMKPEGASGLRNRQALAMVTIVDLTECLVIDHNRARCQARSWAPSRGGSENVLAQP
jgi:hypothetical protein